ncbi:MAG: hypothetical protein J3R72DRAFT_517261 [Linnemannia gamsii]|nr:MAG: hypothetical protein J3R72DRAFT_517261 [Linnemannia gamsii]
MVIFTIDLNTLVSGNDDTSEWSAIHNRTVDIKPLADILGGFRTARSARAAVATSAVIARGTSTATSETTIGSHVNEGFPIPIDYNHHAASSPLTEFSIPVDTTSNIAMILDSISEPSNERITPVSHSNLISPNEPITPDNHTNNTSPSDPTIPNNHSSDATNDGTQFGSARRASIPTFSSDPSNLPMDYDFTNTVFETPDHDLQTIYAFSNTYLFPLHRAPTSVDPDQYDNWDSVLLFLTERPFYQEEQQAGNQQQNCHHYAHETQVGKDL